jgi:hypothetical protein
MIWTAITVDRTLKAKHHVLSLLSHDGDKALMQAKQVLSDTTIIAMIKGNHGTSTYIPPQV